MTFNDHIQLLCKHFFMGVNSFSFPSNTNRAVHEILFQSSVELYAHVMV